MDLNQFPLSAFEVDCDGSACGSGHAAGLHVHPPQDGVPAIARVVVRENTRLCYRPAEDITRLVSAA
jgi:hypothetical protein